MDQLPTISNYQTFQHLGGGPMTNVYAARHLTQHNRCALKVLRDDWAEPDTAIKFLQREARAGLKVRHSHLIKIRETHVLKPPYFLVMDLLTGESLRDRLQRGGALSISVALWVTRQVAEALNALHRVGFLHGDVKPENVQILEDGTTMLIDLGFAHRPGENANFLKKGYVIGTPNYLAPELCVRNPDATFSSDIFSLGVMLFEMLTGDLPYPAGTVAQTFRRHGYEPPADVRQWLTEIPDGLERLLRRLLSRRPEARPTASTVIQQLVALELDSLCSLKNRTVDQQVA